MVSGAFLCKLMEKNYSPPKSIKGKNPGGKLSLIPFYQLLLPPLLLCSLDSFLFITLLPPLSRSPALVFLLLFWRAICFQRGRSEWVRAGGSVSVSSLDMFRLKPFAPRNNLLWTQSAAGLLVSSSGNLKCFEYVGGFFSPSLGSFEFEPFGLFYRFFYEL